MKKIILCGELFMAMDDHVEKNMAIVIEDNKIIDILSGDKVNPEEGELIDLSDKFVMPGLIDGHVHVNSNGEPGWADLTKTIGDYTIDSMLHAQDDLMAGFTGIRDEGGRGFSDVALRNAINAGKVVGPRMLVSGMAIGSTGGHADTGYAPGVTEQNGFGLMVDSPDEGRKAARYNLKHGADQIKIMATGGVISPTDEPGPPELTLEEMKAILDVPNSGGRISSAHAHGAEGIKRAIKAGITSIEHGMLMDEECIDMMVEHGTYLIPTIIAAHQIIVNGVEAGIADYAVRKAKICLENHYDNLKKCINRGVKIGFGSDAGTPYNIHGKQALEFELMVEAGFTPAQTLLAATRVNSHMMKWNDRVGSIEIGKLADIIAFPDSPMRNIKVMMDCCFVMKDGIVYKNQ